MGFDLFEDFCTVFCHTLIRQIRRNGT